jgi:hypothetical protein
MLRRKGLSSSEIKSEMLLPHFGIPLPVGGGPLYSYVLPLLFKGADIFQLPNFFS